METKGQVNSENIELKQFMTSSKKKKKIMRPTNLPENCMGMDWVSDFWARLLDGPRAF